MKKKPRPATAADASHAPTVPPETLAHVAEPPREFLVWVEAARTILMAGVVLVHVNFVAAPEVTRWWPFHEYSILGYGSMVPAFFMIAGLVVGLGNVTSASFDAKRFVKRKVLTLVVPFLCWNAVMIGLDLGLQYDFILRRDQENLAFHVLLRMFTGYWQLYFVSALLQCFALFLLVRRFLVGRGLVVVTAVAVLITASFYGLASLLFWTGIRQDVLFENYLDRTFPPWCGYFFVGLYLGQRPKARAAVGRFFWLFGGLAVATFPIYIYELHKELPNWPDTPLLQFLGTGFPFQMFGAIAYVGVFEWLGRRRFAEGPLRGIAGLASLSLGVFLCHNAIVVPLYRYWVKTVGGPTPAELSVPSIFLWALLLAVLLVAVGRRIGPLGRLLFVSRAPGR